MALDKLVDSTQLDSDLTSVANAIRAKSGGSSQLAFPAGFVSEIGNISGGGDPYDIAKKLNANTLTSWTEQVSSVRAYLFYGCSNLTSFDFTNTTNIGAHAFENSGISALSISNEVTLGDSAFAGATSLASVVLPNFTGGNVNGVFNGCSGLTTVNLPKATQCGLNYFRSCTNLVTLVLPKCTSIGQYFTYTDGKLEAVDFGGATMSIPANGLAKSGVLSTIVLRSTSVAALANINALADTPFASGKSGGTLYVPNSLISSYQNASNWSTILGYANNSIQKIEGSYYETHYADGTAIS